jgi:hypothetical protein
MKHARSFGGSLECQAKSCLVVDHVANNSKLGRVLDRAVSGNWHSHEVAEECLALNRMGGPPPRCTMHVLARMRVISWLLNPSGWFPGRSSSRAVRPRGVSGGCLANHRRLPSFFAGHHGVCTRRPYSKLASFKAADARPPRTEREHAFHQEVASPGRGCRDQRDARLPPFPFWLRNPQAGGRRNGQYCSLQLRHRGGPLMRPFDAAV